MSIMIFSPVTNFGHHPVCMYDLMSMSLKKYKLNYLAFNTGFFLNYRYIEVENLLRKLKAKYTLSFIYLDFVQYITIGRKTAGILSKRRQ